MRFEFLNSKCHGCQWQEGEEFGGRPEWILGDA